MNSVAHPLQFLKLLAHDLRWSIVQSLSMTDLRVGELVEQINQPTNLVSYHLKQLRDGSLVTSRRSDADGRDVYYSLNYTALANGFRSVQKHTATGASPTPAPHTPMRVLFLCTHNSARSQMAEGLMRTMGGTSVRVHSAGNDPTQIKPDAIKAMDELGIDIREQTINRVDEFVHQKFDYVITVCDRARETCPVFETDSVLLHWGISPPSAPRNGQNAEQAYRSAALILQSRIDYFLSSVNLKDM